MKSVPFLPSTAFPTVFTALNKLEIPKWPHTSCAEACPCIEWTGMDINNRKFPVSLMLDSDCHLRLQAVSRSTRLSMSELVRLSVRQALRQLGDPERPDPEAVTALLREVAAAPEMPRLD